MQLAHAPWDNRDQLGLEPEDHDEPGVPDEPGRDVDCHREGSTTIAAALGIDATARRVPTNQPWNRATDQDARSSLEDPSIGQILAHGE